MKQLYRVLILSCNLFGLPALAEQSSIKPQSQGEVTFVSGGIGEDEQHAMQAMRGDYNLNLLFSIQGSGEYLSDVKVQVADSTGNTVLESVSDGPMLFAKLKPGRYAIAVDREGQVVRKKATISGTKRTSLIFTWPQNEE